MSRIVSKIISLFVISFLIISCNERDELRNRSNEQKSFLHINSDIVKLSDDSTKIAGLLEINSNTPQVELKWNLPEGANIDTTLTTLKLNEGRGELSIKWDKSSKDKTFGPVSMAYDGGVLISTGDQMKYVHLVWADRIDSTEVLSRSMTLTRATDPLVEPVVISLNPELVPMDIVTGGEMYVSFKGTESVFFDHVNIKKEYNIIKKDFPGIILAPQVIKFKWNADLAPKFNFTADVLFIAEGVSKVGTINYIVPQETPTIWEFIDSTPSEGNTVLANEARIVVQVKTNKPWSLECDNGLTSPVSDFGTALENRTLVMHLSNNTSADSREITVLVKSQDDLQKKLTFNQLGQGQTGTFDFLSSTPANGGVLPGSETSVDVTVQSDVAWWIKCDCGKRVDYPAGELGEKTGTVTVTENKTGAPRVVTVTVGYGDTTAKTLNFVQNVSGAVDPGVTLVYVSSTLPVGNIPASGKTYNFIFSGTYKGNLQMGMIIDGGNLIEGESITVDGGENTVQMKVPENTTAKMRRINFKYRSDGAWIDLTGTERMQDAGTGIVGTVTPGDVLPANSPMPDCDMTYFCTFTGDYTGDITFRAVREEPLLGSSGKVNEQLKVFIPRLKTKSEEVRFEYSLNGEDGPWTLIESRMQNSESFTISPISPVSKYIEAGAVPCSCKLGGTFSNTVIVKATVDNVELVRGSAKGPDTINFTIPENTGTRRDIAFYYSKNNGQTWTTMEIKVQKGKL